LLKEEGVVFEPFDIRPPVEKPKAKEVFALIRNRTARVNGRMRIVVG
jgi:hypothetical protein